MANTKALIEDIEEKVGCRLVVLYYNTEDQAFLTQLALDILHPLRSGLKTLDLKDGKPLGLFLQSNGGALESPWPIVSAIRAATRATKNEFWVIVADKAHSAATLITLAADSILMSPFASLSPIDPQLTVSPGPNVRIGAGIEDVIGYFDLIKELFPNDDMARVQAFSLLAQRIPAEVLGNVQRVHEFVELMVKKMLESRKTPSNTEEIQKLTKALTKGFCSHNYQISVPECEQLTLPVKVLVGAAEESVGKLFGHYRQLMEIGKDLILEIPGGQVETTVAKKRAFLETNSKSFIFKSNVTVNRDRTAKINDLGWQEETNE